MDEATFSSDEEVLEVDGVNFSELAMVASTQNHHAVEIVESGGHGDGDTQQRSGAGAAVLVLDDGFDVAPLQSVGVGDPAASNHHPPVSISKGADGYRLAGVCAGLVRCCAMGRSDCREQSFCFLPKLSCSNKACNTPLAPPPVCACLCRAWRARGRRIGAVLGRAGHFRTSVCGFSGRFARCAWCRVTGECCSESICVRLFGSQVGRAARRTRPRASVECPAVVRTVPCWFCSSALGGCNAGGQRVVGREKRAYIFAARLTVGCAVPRTCINRSDM